jgi:hypothetical protein
VEGWGGELGWGGVVGGWEGGGPGQGPFGLIGPGSRPIGSPARVPGPARAWNPFGPIGPLGGWGGGARDAVGRGG